MGRSIQNQDDRFRLYKLLHVGQRELGMTEDDFRGLLARCGAKAVDGQPSKTTMSNSQLIEAFNEMKRLGFKPKSGFRPGTSTEGDNGPVNVAAWKRPRVEKMRALWKSLADAGVVNNPTEVALNRFCARISGRPIQWASSSDLNKCIEALKSWCNREGVIDGHTGSVGINE